MPLPSSSSAVALARTKAVTTRIGVTLNEAKTSLWDYRHESCEFRFHVWTTLQIEGQRFQGAGPSRKSVQRLKTKLGDMLAFGERRPSPAVSKRLNQMLNGWEDYFRNGPLLSLCGD